MQHSLHRILLSGIGKCSPLVVRIVHGRAYMGCFKVCRETVYANAFSDGIEGVLESLALRLLLSVHCATHHPIIEP